MFLLTLFSRIPFASQYLYNWDAAQFALATNKFSIVQHQPHPPGYIIYIYLGKLISFVFSNINTAFVTISIIASAITVVIFYRFVRLLTSSNKFAISLSLILIFNPYFWLYGEVASTYIFDALFSVLFAFLAIKIIKGKKYSNLYFFTFALTISGGFRQSLVLFFAPLWIFSFFILIKNQGIRIKKILINIFTALLGISSWLLPLAYLSGGWDKYWKINYEHFSHILKQTAIFTGNHWGLASTNFKSMAAIMIIIANITMLYWIIVPFCNKKKNKSEIKKTFSPPIQLLFLFWLAPSFLLFLLIHFGNSGYLMSVALAVIILCAVPILILLRQHSQKLSFLLVGLTIFFQILLFFSPHASLAKKMHQNHPWLQEHTLWKIKQLDSKTKNYIEEILSYPPEETIVITLKNFYYRPSESNTWIKNKTEYFRKLEYYLPDYYVYEVFWEKEKYFVVKNYSELKPYYGNVVYLPAKTENILIIAENLDKNILTKNYIQKEKLSQNTNIFRINMNNKKSIKFHQYELRKTKR